MQTVTPPWQTCAFYVSFMPALQSSLGDECLNADVQGSHDLVKCMKLHQDHYTNAKQTQDWSKLCHLFHCSNFLKV